MSNLAEHRSILLARYLHNLSPFRAFFAKDKEVEAILSVVAAACTPHASFYSSMFVKEPNGIIPTFVRMYVSTYV